MAADRHEDPVAAGEAAGQLYRYGLSHSGVGAEKEQAVVRDLTASVPLDDVATLLNLPRLDLIKADMEGWKLNMLKGSAQSVERFRPCMMLELVDRLLNRAGDSLDAALRFLDTAEYRPATWRQGRFVDADPASPLDGGCPRNE